MVRLNRIKKGTNTSANAKKRKVLRLLSAPDKYIKRKIEIAYKKLVKKEPKKTFKAPNILESEETLKRKSMDELKEIAKLRGIKNRGKLKKEALITILLKSESSNADRNYVKYFNNTTNVSNNTNVNNSANVNNNTNDDDTYDGKIRDKISDIRVILSRLGDLVTKNDRKEIKNELYEIENKRNHSDEENKRFMIILLN